MYTPVSRFTSKHLVFGLFSIPLYFYVSPWLGAGAAGSSFSSNRPHSMFFKIPPIVSGWLPALDHTAGGEVPIGHAFIRAPPIEKYRFETPILTETGEPGIEIGEVGYAVYYPTTKEGARKHGVGVKWVPEPAHALIEGFEKFLGPRASGWVMQVLRHAVGRVQFPVSPLAPLAAPTAPSPTKSASGKYPLAIFSHGLAGTRNAYSQYCSALASLGYVVLVVEHRDGTGPSVLIPDFDSNEKGKMKTRLWIKLEDLTWKEGEDDSLARWGRLQLEMRVREVYETYHSFRRLLDPSTSNTIQLERAIIAGAEDSSAAADWLDTFKGHVDVENVLLTGHSFGGGTMMHLLKTPPPESPKLAPIPAVKCISLDPWLETLPIPAPPTPDSPDIPLLVVNSPGFTTWKEHFERLVKQVKEGNGTLLTLLKSEHQSFSDFQLLLPYSPTPALTALAAIRRIDAAFLEGTLPDLPELKGKVPDEGNIQVKKGAEDKDELDLNGDEGTVLVHLLGRMS